MSRERGLRRFRVPDPFRTSQKAFWETTFPGNALARD
jgi:hypothetical protein